MTQRFDKAAKAWDSGDVRQNISSAVFKTLTSRIALLNTMKILDFGAGTGLLSFKIAPMVRSVTGVDLSGGMLEQLEAKNTPALHVTPLLQDIMENPLDQKFNGIVSSMAMHHVADTKRLFQTFYEHLQRDGFIAIADLEEEDGTFHAQHGNDGVHHFGFNRDMLRGTIEKAGFRNVRFHDAYSVNREDGSYPIFLVTAMK
ncbi:MAG: methyltransferase domain-containing protein [Sulfuricurvum sp.]|nr:methyltransferase domain-containing protein [Sulfuricurvum sp.]MDP3023685.1 methyltransferase domain-containing protein [Sulfuricurvum sp.]